VVSYYLLPLLEEEPFLFCPCPWLLLPQPCEELPPLPEDELPPLLLSIEEPRCDEELDPDPIEEPRCDEEELDPDPIEEPLPQPEPD
jgi:hypothetical protein